MSARMEKLISQYKKNYKRLQEVERLIAQYTVTQQDVIQEKVFISSGEERVQTSNTTDRTASTALILEEKVEKYNEELSEERAFYEQEKEKLERENALFEKALNRISSDKRAFAKDLFRGEKWDALALKYHISRATVGNWKKEVVCEMETAYNEVEQDLMRTLLY